MKQLFNEIDAVFDEMVQIRRHLHQNPELSFEEIETASYIANYHKELGHEVRTNVGGTGVLAYLKGGLPGSTVALRADFDALPIQEQTDLAFKSSNDGVMHACGHDGHTATLLGLAKVLNGMKEKIPGTVVFLHQHAEELPPGGAISMIEDGCLEGVDMIFGTHLQAQSPLGQIGYRAGAIQAAPDQFDITIKGEGGHGAYPQDTKDSILIGAQLITNLQQIVSRRINPMDAAVVSVCNFEAKNPYNVIADSAHLIGTVRTFNEETRDFIEKEIEKVIQGTCQISDASYEYKYTKGYPALINDEKATDIVAGAARKVPGLRKVVETPAIMAGEDFSYYLHHIPGAFFYTGAQNPEWAKTYPHHHPKFDFDERALSHAAKVLGQCTLDFLGADKSG